MTDISAEASQERLGKFVQHHFREAREERNQLINAHVRRVSKPPERELFERKIRASLTPRSGERTVPAVPVPLTRRRRPWLVGGVVLALAALLVGSVWLARSAVGHRKPDLAAAQPQACKAGFKRCKGDCVSVDSPEFGCSSDSCFPCRVSNATPRCNADHRCDIAVCYQAYDNCDGDASNGCEAEVELDPDHCGGCGQRCPDLPRATRGCGGTCTIWRCAPGFRDCNDETSDGCEVDARSNPSQCGHCQRQCAPGKRCEEGECVR